MNAHDDSGRVFVPFDLRRDVIEPLQRVEEKLDAHISSHETALEAVLDRREAARRQRLLRALKLAAAVIGGTVTTVGPILLGVFGGGK